MIEKELKETKLSTKLYELLSNEKKKKKQKTRTYEISILFRSKNKCSFRRHTKVHMYNVKERWSSDLPKAKKSHSLVRSLTDLTDLRASIRTRAGGPANCKGEACVQNCDLSHSARCCCCCCYTKDRKKNAFISSCNGLKQFMLIVREITVKTSYVSWHFAVAWVCKYLHEELYLVYYVCACACACK